LAVFEPSVEMGVYYRTQWISCFQAITTVPLPCITANANRMDPGLAWEQE